MSEHAAVVQLVKKLGGPLAISRGLGEILGDSAPTRGSVQQWPVLSRVPWKWRHAVRNLAQQRGINLTEEELSILSLEPEREAS